MAALSHLAIVYTIRHRGATTSVGATLSLTLQMLTCNSGDSRLHRACRMVSMMQPGVSWVSRWLKMRFSDGEGRVVPHLPGIYAIALPGEVRGHTHTQVAPVRKHSSAHNYALGMAPSREPMPPIAQV